MISVEEVLSVCWSGGPALRRERPQCSRRIGSMVRLEPVGLRDLSLVKVRGERWSLNCHVSASASGLFAAVGGSDWASGLACGSCAELEYRGHTVTVNVVDRCGGCSKGWFDLGGPAWRALTGGQPPGHVYGVRSRWVSCPLSLTGGRNLHVYVKPGSHAWDARFQPTHQVRPVEEMYIDGGRGWQRMAKCENFMFCKPAGITLHGRFRLRLFSDTGNIETRVAQLTGGSYIDTGTNNGGPCTSPPTRPTTVTTPPRPPPTTTPRPPESTTTAGWEGSSQVDCSVMDGLYPDPDNCRGFIKCAQVTSMDCRSQLSLEPDIIVTGWEISPALWWRTSFRPPHLEL